MEVTVLDVSNPPTKPVLAIHAGSVRRQAKLEVNQPFVIPHPGTQSGPVEVSLFQQLASHVLPSDDAPEVFCNIPVKTLDGQTSEVQLRVRRGEAAKAGKPPQKGEDSMGVTRDYLDHHQLQQRIQSLIQDVLREQPDNPYKYMLMQLKKTQGGSGPTNATAKQMQESEKVTAPPTQPSPQEETKPLVPRPPDAPKPGVPRGRNASVKSATVEDCNADINFGRETTPAFSARKSQDEAYNLARFSMTNLLRMPLCKKAADGSLRNAARVASSKSICSLVLQSVKEKISDEVGRGTDRECVRSILMEELPPEYNRALATWARHLAYRGAGHILGVSRPRRASESEPGRRSSMPTPIVFLESSGSLFSGSPAKMSSSATGNAPVGAPKC